MTHGNNYVVNELKLTRWHKMVENCEDFFTTLGLVLKYVRDFYLSELEKSAQLIFKECPLGAQQ